MNDFPIRSIKYTKQATKNTKIQAIIFFTGSLFSISFLFLKNHTIFTFLILVVLGFYCSIYFVETILRIKNSRINLTKNGMEYIKPGFRILCNWSDIESLQIDKEFFNLFCSIETKIVTNRFQILFIGNKKVIPISSFVHSWVSEIDWDTNELLAAIKINRPDIYSLLF